MTKIQERRFKRALEAKRDELIREISESRERLTLDPTGDPMDQIRGTAERDFVIRGIDRMCGMLRLVEGALREIQDRTFGVCAECGDDIPAKRLQAVPWSPYCVSCQERIERCGPNAEVWNSVQPYALAS
jgi:DnaK suppressor protein